MTAWGTTGRGVSRLRRSPRIRSLLATGAILAAIAVSGCQVDGTLPTSTKAMMPLSPKIVAEMDKLNMDKEAPILVRVFKQESELEVWKQDRNGRFALLKTYPICRWSGELGPKLREGDRQAPEGFYTITPHQMNPNSQFYLAFDLGYPNAYDRAHGRTGAHLMVHGDCSSRGCYSMTDEQISEIYALGREVFFGGQKAFQVQAYPFRMTPQNFAKHRDNPHLAFWKMLKRGNDHFEVTRLEPKVSICERRYVFDAEHPSDPNRPLSFSPAGKCPAYEVNSDVTAAVLEKQRRDELQTAELVRHGTPVAPIKTHADGGMHPVFAAAVKRNEVGVTPAAYSVASSVPGTIPATVRPPKTAEFVDTPNGPMIAGTSPSIGSVGIEPQPARAVAAEQTTSSSKATATTGSLFSNIIADTKAKTDNAFNSVATLFGLRGPEPKPKPPEAIAPKSKAATRPNGAVRPKPAAEPKPAATAAVQTPVPAAAPAAPATAAVAPPRNTIAGAAPTVPAGSFESRWPSFR